MLIDNNKINSNDNKKYNNININNIDNIDDNDNNDKAFILKCRFQYFLQNCFFCTLR